MNLNNATELGNAVDLSNTIDLANHIQLGMADRFAAYLLDLFRFSGTTNAPTGLTTTDYQNVLQSCDGVVDSQGNAVPIMRGARIARTVADGAGLGDEGLLNYGFDSDLAGWGANNLVWDAGEALAGSGFWQLGESVVSETIHIGEYGRFSFDIKAGTALVRIRSGTTNLYQASKSSGSHELEIENTGPNQTLGITFIAGTDGTRIDNVSGKRVKPTQLSTAPTGLPLHPTTTVRDAQGSKQLPVYYPERQDSTAYAEGEKISFAGVETGDELWDVDVDGVENYQTTDVIAGGVVTVTSTASGDGRIAVVLSGTASGERYRVSGAVDSLDAGSLIVAYNSSPGLSFATDVTIDTFTAAGSFHSEIEATDTQTHLVFKNTGQAINDTFTVSSLSATPITASTTLYGEVTTGLGGELINGGDFTAGLGGFSGSGTCSAVATGGVAIVTESGTGNWHTNRFIHSPAIMDGVSDYEFTFDARITSGVGALRFVNGATEVSVVSAATASDWVTVSGVFTSNSTQPNAFWIASASVWDIDNVSVRKVLPTAAALPTYSIADLGTEITDGDAGVTVRGYHTMQGMENWAGAENVLKESKDLSAWTLRGTATINQNITGADGVANTGWTVSVAGGGNDLFLSAGGLITATRYEPSFWVKQITETGTINMQNPSGSGGIWSIDLSKLSKSWELVTRDHAAVNVSSEFTTGAGTAAGILFKTGDGVTRSFGFYEAQQEVGEKSTPIITTTGSTATRTATNTSDILTGITPQKGAFALLVNPGASGQSKYLLSSIVNIGADEFRVYTSPSSVILAKRISSVTIDASATYTHTKDQPFYALCYWDVDGATAADLMNIVAADQFAAQPAWGAGNSDTQDTPLKSSGAGYEFSHGNRNDASHFNGSIQVVNAWASKAEAEAAGWGLDL